MSVRFKLLAVTLAAGVTARGFVVISVPTVAAAAPTWTTTFRDDFSGTGLPNSDDWQLTLGTSYPGGPANFGTGEIETLTNDPANVDVRNGHLVITPQRDAAGAWTSARVETTRANFKPPAGGVMHVESRVQMPNVTGAEAMGYWPAFWMLGSPYRADRWSWPGIGEFDIMENVQGLNWSYNVLHCGSAPGAVPATSRRASTTAAAACQVTTCQAGFHTYAIEWDRTGAADQLRWYIDGTLTFTVNQSQVPAAIWSSLADHAGYFIILNVAIGGAFPNKLGGGPTAPPSRAFRCWSTTSRSSTQAAARSPRHRHPPTTATHQPHHDHHARPRRTTTVPTVPAAGSAVRPAGRRHHRQHDHPRLERHRRRQPMRSCARGADRDRHRPDVHRRGLPNTPYLYSIRGDGSHHTGTDRDHRRRGPVVRHLHDDNATTAPPGSPQRPAGHRDHPEHRHHRLGRPGRRQLRGAAVRYQIATVTGRGSPTWAASRTPRTSTRSAGTGSTTPEITATIS